MWSPILKIELLKEGRHIRLPITVIFYNAILAFVMLLFMVFNAETFQEGYYYNTSSYLHQFLIISSLQIAAVFLLIPFYVSGMFAVDREKYMMEQFAMIPGFNGQFVVAKIMMVLFINGLLFLSALPIICLSCIYSGISCFKVIRLGIMILLFSFWSGSITIFFYSVRARIRWAMAGTVITQFMFVAGTVMIMEVIRNCALSFSESGSLPAEVSGICLFFMILNPLASYMGYYGNLTGETGLISFFCGHFGIDATSKTFSLFFYKVSSLMCLLVGILFLYLAVCRADRRQG